MIRFTSNLVLDILIYVLIAFLVMLAFNIAQVFYLRKYKPNKWVLLVALVLVVVGSSFIAQTYSLWWVGLVGIIVALFLMLWTFERFRDKNVIGSKNSKGKVQKEIINKPKAKPNRAKKLQEK